MACCNPCSACCCVAPYCAPPRCSCGPPLLPPFTSPANLPKYSMRGCGMPACPPKCGSLSCRAAPCNYPNPAYDCTQRMCGPVPGCGSCSRPCGCSPICHALCGRYFPSCSTACSCGCYGCRP